MQSSIGTLDGSGTFTLRDSVRVSGLQLSSGDTVHVAVSGYLGCGPFIGYTDARGTDAGFLGVPTFDKYDIVPSAHHGCLLYRVGDEHPWQPVPFSSKAPVSLRQLKAQIVPDSRGFLWLAINDKEPSNNSGRYTIDLSRRHK